MERLNDQLRKINLSLRQQAKAGTIYGNYMSNKEQRILDHILEHVIHVQSLADILQQLLVKSFSYLV